METLFYERLKEYFKDDYDLVLEKLKSESKKSFFINGIKANSDVILKMIDFNYQKTINPKVYYYDDEVSIGKTKVYELGLIYPQELSASLPALIADTSDVHLAIDLASAPGGKTINILNRLIDNALLIANEIDYKRAQVLVSNLERLGFSNVIITNKKTSDFHHLDGSVDLVILDAPCSGEGMIKKYPEIIKEYSLANINQCAKRQSEILEDAYRLLKKGGQLIYSTCTFAYEEDEKQVQDFLKRHRDMKLKKFKIADKEYEGMAKFTFLDDMEGQFMAYMIKEEEGEARQVKYKKTVSNKLVEDFIKDNLNLDNYYLYEQNGHYYLSLQALIDLKDHVLRYAIYLGDIIKNRFEPSHHLYRAIALKDSYKNVYHLSEEEYDAYVKGLELDADVKNGYYALFYKDMQFAYGKASNGKIKNKYPKGLRKTY